jgi:hypothetical protein
MTLPHCGEEGERTLGRHVVGHWVVSHRLRLRTC